MTIERKTYKGKTTFIVRLSDPDTGERKSIGTFSTRREAEAAQERAAENRLDGLPLIPEPTKGDTLLDVFIDTIYLPLMPVSGRTKSDYKVSCKQLKDSFCIYHTKEYLCRIRKQESLRCPSDCQHRSCPPISSITNSDVHLFNNRFAYRRNKTGDLVLRSDNHRRKVAQRLRQVFNVAVEEGYIAASEHPYRADASKRNKLPARRKDTTRAVMPYEAAKTIVALLKKHSDDPYVEDFPFSPAQAQYWYFLLGTALNSGLRRSELLGLRVSDLDDKRGNIEVHRQYGWQPHSPDPDVRFPPHPKSGHGNRDVPLTRNDFDVVRGWAHRMVTTHSPDDLLFPRPINRGDEQWGYWESESYFSKSYKEAMSWAARRYFANLKDGEVAKFTWDEMTVVFHQWRTTFSVFCLTEAHIDINTLSKWLGHYSPEFTYAQYSRYVDGVSDEAVNRVALAKGYGSGGEQQVSLEE